MSWGIGRLSSVYRAVVQNACEAMPNGGVLQIQVGNCLIDENSGQRASEARAGAYLSFVFRDTGIGIEPHLLPRAAEPFFTSKHPKQGHGFGLSSSQAIVKGHKGFMVLESEQGQGTTLSVFIPAEISAEEASGLLPPLPLTQAGRGKRVLVVDDECFVRETIQQALEERAYEVITTPGGSEALAIFASRMDEIDLVITNIEMPDMDGLGLCRALRKLKPDAKVLVSSGHQQQNKIEEIKSAGVQHVLPKPYTAEHLAGCVEAILSEG